MEPDNSSMSPRPWFVWLVRWKTVRRRGCLPGFGSISAVLRDWGRAKLRVNA